MASDAAGVVRELFAAFARRDVDAAMALAAPDCEFWPQGTAGRTGRETPYIGAEGLGAYFDDVAEIWEHLEVQPDELRVAGEGVVAFGTARGRARNEPTAIEVPVIWVFKVRDGLVRSGRVATTADEVASALAAGEA